MRFGEDFIFTFGPLGIFATRLNIGVSTLGHGGVGCVSGGRIANGADSDAARDTHLPLGFSGVLAHLFTVVAPTPRRWINTLFVIYLFLLIYPCGAAHCGRWHWRSSTVG